MANRVISDEQKEHIITMRKAGMTNADIAAIVGLSEKSVISLTRIYYSLNDGKTLAKSDLHYYGHYIQWCCKKLGLDYDAVMSADGDGGRSGEERTADNTALAFAALLEAVKSLAAAVDAIDKRLSAMQMTLAGSRDDANQNAKKLVETININGDIQTKEWQAIRDKLEAIKINTKRRPWKEDA